VTVAHSLSDEPTYISASSGDSTKLVSMNDSEEDSVYSLDEIAAHHGRRKVSTVACLLAADDGVTGIQYFSRMLAGSDQSIKRQFSLQDDWFACC
jgi:hypothetical protein